MSHFLYITSHELFEFGLRLGSQTAKSVCAFPGLCHFLKRPRGSRSREESFLDSPGCPLQPRIINQASGAGKRVHWIKVPANSPEFNL